MAPSPHLYSKDRFRLNGKEADINMISIPYAIFDYQQMIGVVFLPYKSLLR